MVSADNERKPLLKRRENEERNEKKDVSELTRRGGKDKRKETQRRSRIE
jgi:hypothetical protein